MKKLKQSINSFFREKTKQEKRTEIIEYCIELIEDEQNGFDEFDKNRVYGALMHHRGHYLAVKNFELASSKENFNNIISEL